MSLDIYLYIRVDVGGIEPEYVEFYSANITHNLGKMAEKAGIYQHLWRFEENGFKYAEELIRPIKDGIAWMKDYPDNFKKYNAPNGWGTYDQFLPWLEDLLEACERYPKALVETSR